MELASLSFCRRVFAIFLFQLFCNSVWGQTESEKITTAFEQVAATPDEGVAVSQADQLIEKWVMHLRATKPREFADCLNPINGEAKFYLAAIAVAEHSIRRVQTNELRKTAHEALTALGRECPSNRERDLAFFRSLVAGLAPIRLQRMEAYERQWIVEVEAARVVRARQDEEKTKREEADRRNAEKLAEQQHRILVERREEDQKQEAARNRAIAERADQLRSGKLPVRTIADARIMLNPGNGSILVVSTPYQADGNRYVVFGLLDSWVENGSLLGRIGNKLYGVVVTKDTNFLDGSKARLRQGRPFSVIGRFVYTRSFHDGTASPFFQAEYVSD